MNKRDISTEELGAYVFTDVWARLDQDWLRRKIGYECWVGVLANLGNQLDTSGKSSKRNCLHQIGLGVSVGIFGIVDSCRKAQSTVGGALPRQVGLGF